MQRQQNFAAYPFLDRVHFNHWEVRMLLSEFKIVLISSSYPAFLIHLEPVFYLPAPTHTYYSGHIDIPCCEPPCPLFWKGNFQMSRGDKTSIHFAKVTSTFFVFSNLQKLIPLLLVLGWKLLFQMSVIAGFT